MTPFDFPSWYARMGYPNYRGGQRDCARDLGVTREHVRRLELGRVEPSTTLALLCWALEVIKTVAPEHWDALRAA